MCCRGFISEGGAGVHQIVARKDWQHSGFTRVTERFQLQAMRFAEVRVIDIHAHLWAFWARPISPTSLPRNLISGYDEFAMERARASSWNLLYDPAKGNEEIYDPMQEFPERLIGFCVASPQQPRAAEEVDRCVRRFGMKGVKLHPTLGKWKEDFTVANSVLQRVEAHEIPVLIHTWSDDFSHPVRARKALPWGDHHHGSHGWGRVARGTCGGRREREYLAGYYSDLQPVPSDSRELGSDRIL